MSQFVFADEAGCFTFERKQNVSQYFIICTITTSDLEVGRALQELRRRLIWENQVVGDYFHATEDAQSIRDAVFKTLLQHDFKVQATILEKSKAQPEIRETRARFYRYPWFYHFKYGISSLVKRDAPLLVTAASIGNKKEKLAFRSALDDVMRQTLAGGNWAVDFRPSATEACLQAADYCAWAIQRKWERNDARSYDLIKDRITYEHEQWSRGTTHYY